MLRKKKDKKIPTISLMRWYRVFRLTCAPVSRPSFFVFGVRFMRAVARLSLYAFERFTHAAVSFLIKKRQKGKGEGGGPPPHSPFDSENRFSRRVFALEKTRFLGRFPKKLLSRNRFPSRRVFALEKTGTACSPAVDSPGGSGRLKNGEFPIQAAIGR